MKLFALLAIGRDRPGIVAEISTVLAQNEVNIEDSEMAVLKGYFAMMITLQIPERVSLEEFSEQLKVAKERLGLVELELDQLQNGESVRTLATHCITIYGADHPGIVRAVTKVLADAEVSITSLSTRAINQSSGQRLYVMTLEVSADQVDTQELERLLKDPSAKERIDFSVQELADEKL